MLPEPHAIAQTAKGTGQHQVVRRVNVVRGAMPFRMECYPAFNYARDDHQTKVTPDGACFYSPGLSLGLATRVPLKQDVKGVSVEFRLEEGQMATFLLQDIPAGTGCGISLSEQEAMESFKNTVEYYLTEGGLIEDTKDPDLYVTYHTNSSEEVRYNTTTFGYSYGSAWGYNPYWGGMGGGTTSTTTAQSYQRGSLIIDIWDARTKEIVWRGTAEATVTSNPEKGAKKIDKALKKMIKQYQKLRAEDVI